MIRVIVTAMIFICSCIYIVRVSDRFFVSLCLAVDALFGRIVLGALAISVPRGKVATAIEFSNHEFLLFVISPCDHYMCDWIVG